MMMMTATAVSGGLKERGRVAWPWHKPGAHLLIVGKGVLFDLRNECPKLLVQLLRLQFPGVVSGIKHDRPAMQETELRSTPSAVFLTDKTHTRADQKCNRAKKDLSTQGARHQAPVDKSANTTSLRGRLAAFHSAHQIT